MLLWLLIILLRLPQHFVLLLDYLVQRLLTVHDLEKFGGFLESLCCDETVADDQVGVGSFGTVAEGETCINECVLVTHEALADPGAFQSQLVVENVIVGEHASDELVCRVERALLEQRLKT